MNDDVWNLFLKGFKFVPTDEELVHYLTNKILKKPFWDPTNKFKELLNLYDYSPRQLSDLSGIPSLDYKIYKFQLDRKHSEDKYFTRKVGNGEGYWKAHSTSPIMVDNTSTIDYKKVLQCKRVRIVRHVSLTEGPTLGPFTTKIKVTGKHIVGYKMKLVYYEGKEKHGIPTNWIIDEYRVNRNYLPKWSQTEKWVLCKIYPNTKKENEEEHEFNIDSWCEYEESEKEEELNIDSLYNQSNEKSEDKEESIDSSCEPNNVDL